QGHDLAVHFLWQLIAAVAWPRHGHGAGADATPLRGGRGVSALIALAAGGTGGHMFPAEALARELLSRGLRVALVTDRRGQAFGERLPGVALHRIRAGRFGAGLVSKVVGVAELALGTLEASRLLRKLAPATAVGFGGYPSVPTMLAATRLRVPTLVHEQ